MRNLRYHSIVALLVLSFVPVAAQATVSLVFVDQDGTNNGSVNVAAGGSFNVRLNLVTTSNTTDDHTGLDYYLTMLEGSSGSGLFSIQDRNISTSPYSDTIFDDSIVEALPSALLDPRNDDDLGAAVASSAPLETSATYNAGTFLVAFFTIKVNPATPFGTYSLQTTTNDPGSGWSGRHDVPNDPYPDNPFSSHANYTIVVPEPAGLGAFGAFCLILGRRRARA